MIRLGRRAVLAALQWLGFVDLSAAPAPPASAAPPAWEHSAQPDDMPPDGHIWIGAFVLSGSSPRR